MFSYVLILFAFTAYKTGYNNEHDSQTDPILRCCIRFYVAEKSSLCESLQELGGNVFFSAGIVEL